MKRKMLVIYGNSDVNNHLFVPRTMCYIQIGWKGMCVMSFETAQTKLYFKLNVTTLHGGSDLGAMSVNFQVFFLDAHFTSKRNGL